MFEVSEQEYTPHRIHLVRILSDYASRGFTTALDDFGAGFANLGLLAQLQPHVIKLDMALVREVDADPVRQVLVRGLLAICRDLEIDVVAEGIETVAEYRWLEDAGVRYMQGYLVARPGFEKLPEVGWP